MRFDVARLQSDGSQVLFNSLLRHIEMAISNAEIVMHLRVTRLQSDGSQVLFNGLLGHTELAVGSAQIAMDQRGIFRFPPSNVTPQVQAVFPYGDLFIG